MAKIKLNKLDLKTKDLHEKNIAKLTELFPQVLTEMEVEETDSEGKNVKKLVKTIDSEKLKELVGSYSKKDSEIYELTWAGKQDSKRKIAEPITKTLRPVKGDSEDGNNTGNLYIEGDNFEVLKLLQNSYLGKVKMIYIDPPYNTGKDFVYKDNFRTSKVEHDEESGVVDEDGNKLIKNVVTNGRFHSDWLSMMYERLVLARDLLKDDGVIFISIDDNEVANLRKMCDEIFGEGNFIANLVWANKEGGGSSDSKYFRIKHEYVLVYGKDINLAEINGVEINNLERYTQKDKYEPERGPFYPQKLGMGSIQYSTSLDYTIKCPDNTFVTPLENNSGKKACWRWSKQKFEWGLKSGFIEFKKDKGGVWIVYTKQYLNCDNEGNVIKRTQRPFGVIDEYSSTQANKKLQELFGIPIFDYSKPVDLIEHLAKLVSTREDIILDFFSGSATSAHAVMQLNSEDGGNRKFIMVQLPEETDKESEAFKAGYKNICEIGKERIRRAAKKIKNDLKEKNKQQKLDEEQIEVDSLDFGFKVFKLDESNMKDIYYHPSQVTQAKLDGLADNIKENRSPEDLLYQVLLDLAIPISAKVSEEKIDGKKVFKVENNFLIACFDSNITLDLIKKIAEEKPERLVFRDSSFKDDKEKVNCEEFLKHSLPNTIVKVI